jgi:hypothetical protein
MESIRASPIMYWCCLNIIRYEKPKLKTDLVLLMWTTRLGLIMMHPQGLPLQHHNVWVLIAIVTCPVCSCVICFVHHISEALATILLYPPSKLKVTSLHLYTPHNQQSRCMESKYCYVISKCVYIRNLLLWQTSKHQHPQ